MSKSPFSVWDSAYIGPIAVCVNQYLHCCIGEHVFLWLFLVCWFMIKVLTFQSLKSSRMFSFEAQVSVLIYCSLGRNRKSCLVIMSKRVVRMRVVQGHTCQSKEGF